MWFLQAGLEKPLLVKGNSSVKQQEKKTIYGKARETELGRT